mmetsp:Transcript_77606/g.151904  ORF Transcript_77606/g.151904 Transcript_77606/m.151904 type:complete len:221 (-) Transcript_77606:59-721(-)
MLSTFRARFFFARCTIFTSLGSASMSCPPFSSASRSLSASKPGTGAKASSITPNLRTWVLRSSSSCLSSLFSFAIAAMGPKSKSAPPPPAAVAATAGGAFTGESGPKSSSSSSLSSVVTSTPYFAASSLGFWSITRPFPAALGLTRDLGGESMPWSSSKRRESSSSSAAANMSSSIEACSSCSESLAIPNRRSMVLVPPGDEDCLPPFRIARRCVIFLVV